MPVSLFKCKNMSFLNSSKTELLLVAPEMCLPKVLTFGCRMDINVCISHATPELRNLGVILDFTFSFQSCIKPITKPAFYFRTFSRYSFPILRLKPSSTTFMTSHLDCCNRIPTGVFQQSPSTDSGMPRILQQEFSPTENTESTSAQLSSTSRHIPDYRAPYPLEFSPCRNSVRWLLIFVRKSL